MFKKLKNKNNKKGFTIIEVVITSLVVLMAFSFLVDLLTISWKYNFVSQTNSNIARTLGEQSGIRTKVPDGFPGGKQAYTSSSELYSQLKTDFASAGFEEKDWTVFVDGVKLTSTSNFKYKYGDTINTKIIAKYNWNLLNNYKEDTSQKTIESTRSIYAGFTERKDDINTLKKVN